MDTMTETRAPTAMWKDFMAGDWMKRREERNGDNEKTRRGVSYMSERKSRPGGAHRES